MLGNISSVNNPEFMFSEGVPVSNFNASTLPGGVLVARDIAATDTAIAEALKKRYRGVALPTTANVQRLLGVLQGGSNDNLPQYREGRAIVSGLVRAKVLVPANINLSIGDELTVANYWDASANRTVFSTAASGGTAGALAPVVINGSVVRCANPRAVLQQALTATASDTVQTAWVEMLAPEIKQQTISLLYHGTLADLAAIPLAVAHGPGLIVAAYGTVMTISTGTPTAWGMSFAPPLSTPDAQSVFATEPAFTLGGGTDGIAGTVMGAAMKNDGDTDAAAWNVGTGGSQGVLAAEAARIFPTGALLRATIDASAANQASNLALNLVVRWL